MKSWTWRKNMFGFLFWIIYTKEKTSLWPVHRIYKKCRVEYYESQCTATVSIRLEGYLEPLLVDYTNLVSNVILLQWKEMTVLTWLLRGGKHLPKVINFDPLMVVQLEAWLGLMKVTLNGFHPAEGCVVHAFSGWVLGKMFIAHSQLCSFHLLTNSFET